MLNNDSNTIERQNRMSPNGLVDVSVADLLGRQVEPIYSSQARLIIEGATVLVTGAGGSIGSEIIRQLLHLDAGKILCVDNNEYSLYLLERELQGAALMTDETIILADVRDDHALNAIFRAHKPQLVFHAAAYKHLPLLEREPAAALLTNVLGTHNVVAACVAHNTKRFVNISTDKAANPTSILGMSKRLAEIVVKQHADHDTRIASVRFGNVFGSRGSFVETFMWQIANHLPVKVTDHAMTRYFMTIPQAANLVIEAAVTGSRGNTYVLDMGERFGIVDLINRYVKLSGSRKPDIIYTGLRQGEKLDEALYDSRETRKPTRHPAISAVRVDEGGSVSMSEIMTLCLAAQQGEPHAELRAELVRLISSNTYPAVHTAER